jgi:hypothetical protein
MEWIDKGTYTYEPQHPPLGRIAVALGPFLAGARTQSPHVRPNTLDQVIEGLNLLYYQREYDRTLSLARAGVLPFFWVACAAAYWWGKRIGGGPGAAIAVFLYSFLPEPLAHGGLATNDMAVGAFVGATCVAALYWLESPTLRHAIILGGCAGFAALTKFSAPVLVGAATAAAAVSGLALARFSVRPAIAAARKCLPTVGIVAACALALVWALYRFSVGPVPSFPLPVPAPAFFQGFADALKHNSTGHASYLLGQRSIAGFWYYYPVLLAVKTPIAFLVLMLTGCLLILRSASWQRAWPALAYSVGILAVGIASSINIGVRHLLPLQLGMAVLATVAVLHLLRLAESRKWAGVSLACLLVFFAGASLLSHPDYLPYFNAFAGDHPENIAVDSNLDWGQDLKRLSERLQKAGAQEVTLASFILADLENQHGFPRIRALDPARPSPGWNALSLTALRLNRLGLGDSHPDLTPWPDRIPPTERIGKGMLLWYLPYPTQPPTAR